MGTLRKLCGGFWGIIPTHAEIILASITALHFLNILKCPAERRKSRDVCGMYKKAVVKAT
ncbi:MAG: hypothetical protein LBT21_04345 [Oscillospiraceae bacterium]|nr:hypothetical protein [Oscillospiraceae bacterium]